MSRRMEPCKSLKNPFLLFKIIQLQQSVKSKTLILEANSHLTTVETSVRGINYVCF